MTALEALEKTKKMWKWLALHPEAMKIEYFMKNGIISPEHHNCFLCDYAFENYTRDIFQCTAKCPLFKLWSKKRGKLYRCEKSDSPYVLWKASLLNNKSRTKYANKIVKLCDVRIKELTK